MNKSKLFKVLIVSVVLIAGATKLAYAAGPNAHVYYYADPGYGETWAVNKYLLDMGYSSVRFYESHPVTARYYLGSDAVFYMWAHAAPGRQATKKSGGLRLSAKESADNNAWSIQAKYKNTTSKLRKVKLAYWHGCRTAQTSSYYGDLDYRCSLYGADCTVTFWDKQYPPYVTYFDKQAFYRLKRGDTVKNALETAKGITYYSYGTCGGAETYRIAGDSNEKLVPAGYGDY